MSSKINPDLITDDMMYEGGISPYNPAEFQTNLDRLKEDKLWGEIRRAAKTDPVLQAALERVIILYQLSKEKYGTK